MSVERRLPNFLVSRHPSVASHHSARSLLSWEGLPASRRSSETRRATYLGILDSMSIYAVLWSKIDRNAIRAMTRRKAMTWLGC